MAGDAGSRVWLLPSLAVGVGVSPAAIAYSELPDSKAARVNTAILWFSMVALPLLGELQHWKSGWHEGAVYWMNGHGLGKKKPTPVQASVSPIGDRNRISALHRFTLAAQNL
ncbi:hypothetical protein [Pseudomonas sp. TNT2022 ID642]|uniref:hypothetical protein n=1 Tax=Pseudomonas sp. TNT2022 ID642 TaxID=2942632 RepID=UPI00235E78F8|nr:hypothetical protein [Pseudomonas sp. TNT2022 ID642]